jgi:hypothetical protein
MYLQLQYVLSRVASTGISTDSIDRGTTKQVKRQRTMGHVARDGSLTDKDSRVLGSPKFDSNGT